MHALARAALPLLIAAAPLGVAAACPSAQALRAPVVVADNSQPPAPPPAPAGKAPDAVAYPNSPNGSPVVGNKGAPIVTDKAACADAAAAACPDSPAPSKKSDTSDTAIGTPTTVNGKPAP